MVEPPLTLLLVVALPFTTSIVLALFGGRLGRRSAGALLSAGLAFSFGAAVAIAQAFAAGKSSLVAEIGPWLPLRGADLSLRVDPPMVPVIVALTAVAALVSLAAVAADPFASDRHQHDAARFGAAFCLTVGALLLVAVASDLLLLFAGWELLAAGTYLLVAHGRESATSAAAAMRSFVVARVGDTALLLGILALLGSFRTVDIGEIAQRVNGFAGQPDAAARLQAALLVPSLLVLVAALARSAQLPFQVWLPDTAHQGTVASALIQSSAAGAGVVLLVRLGPVLHPNALAAAAAIGAITAAVASIVALAQADRRSLLAWSTISQLGLVFVSAGTGSAATAVVQLLAHAFGKSAVLLGEGVRGTRIGALAFAASALALLAITTGAGPSRAAALASGSLDQIAITVLVGLAVLVTGTYTARLVLLATPGRAGRVVDAPLTLVATVVLAATALAFAVALASGAASLAVLAVAGLGLGTALARRIFRVPLPAWLVAAARSGFELESLYRASLVVAFDAAARALDVGTERVVTWAADQIGRSVVRAGAWLDRAHHRYAGAGEAIVLAAAVALVAYWSLR